MSSIEWVNQLPADPGQIDIHGLVDREQAVELAKSDRLGIENAPERVNRFVETIPALLVWFRLNHRDFPWRRTRDPWAVLLAEVLLQRTRASTVAHLYPALINRYPSPEEIYEVSDREVFEAVESLGFGNKRTTTLRELSRALVEDHDGRVPDDIDELQKLPRIGPYTARACLCFAFGEPMALIDSNVEVVLGRVFTHSSKRRAHKDEALYSFLDALIPADPELARAFNLAILDLRDAICVDPPNCPECPLQAGCQFPRQSDQ